MARNLTLARALVAVVALAVVPVLAVVAGTGGAVAVAGPVPTPTASPSGVLPDRTIWEFQSTQAPDMWTTSNARWVAVPGASVQFSTAAGTMPVFTAGYTAESMCTGGTSCSVRIVIVPSTGGEQELKPAVGTDFAFDAPGGPAESHSVQRTSDPQLGGTTYTVTVQAATVGGATLQLDDSDFTVTRIG